MTRKIFVFGALILVLIGSEALAQNQPAHKYKIIPYGGIVWTRGYDVLLGGRKGTLTMDKSGMFGIALDINVGKKGAQLELLYNRQDTEMYVEFPDEKVPVSDIIVEYFHIGTVLGTPRGNTSWISSFSLGATHYSPKEEGTDSNWYFSIMLGLGFEYYLSERFGLRFLGRAPYTLLGSDEEFLCNEDGCLKSAGGRGIWQFDLSIGLIIGI
jgi:hypothetical protein